MQPISAQVKNHKGKPAIFLNGEAVAPQIYALTDWPTGKRSWVGTAAVNVKLFADMGFRLFQLDVFFEDMIGADGKLDITYARDQIRGVTDRCPDGAVMLRLHTNPPFAWIKAHPTQCVAYANTPTLPAEEFHASYNSYIREDLKPSLRPSFASEEWLGYMGKMYAEFMKKLAATPEGGSLFAIQVASGVYGENHYWGFLRNEPDVSAPMNAYFRRFLREKYHDTAALRRAWNDKSADLDTASVPGMERLHTCEGIYRDPRRETRISDYYLAQHRSVTDSIEYFSRIVKESWPRPIITGAFYGYYVSVFGREAAGGHLCEERILNSKYVDFMCAPCAYNKNCREPGGPGLSRGLIESVRAHGKLWLDEMDQPSELGTALGGMYVYDRETSIGNNRKQVLEPFLRGGGMWYYDFGELMCAGWWEHPVYQADIKKIKAVYDEYFEREFEDPADVLIVLDTKVFTQTAPLPENDPITDTAAINSLVPAAFMSGAAVDTIYLSDFIACDISKYKAIIFANCALMDRRLRGEVAQKLNGQRTNVIWLTAPALNDGSSLDVGFCRELTGFDLKPLRRSRIPLGKLPEPVGGELGGPAAESRKRSGFRQLFLALENKNADGVEPLGAIDDRFAAAGKRVRGGRTDWFFMLPPVKPEQLRGLFAACGCHIYNSACECTLAGAGLLMIQAREAGRRLITLKNGEKISVTLSAAETAVFDAKSGKRLL